MNSLIGHSSKIGSKISVSSSPFPQPGVYYIFQTSFCGSLGPGSSIPSAKKLAPCPIFLCFFMLHRFVLTEICRLVTMDDAAKAKLKSIPLCKTKAGPRDGDLWIQRVKVRFSYFHACLYFRKNMNPLFHLLNRIKKMTPTGLV